MVLSLNSRLESNKEEEEEVTTPESQRVSPKVIFPLKAVVFKSGNRLLSRFGMNSPPPTLWRGKTSPLRRAFAPGVRASRSPCAVMALIWGLGCMG